MKYLLFVMSVVSAFGIAANAEVKCVKFAEKKAAKYLEMSLAEFRESNSLIFTCKQRANTNLETIQFGDGRGLVGVEVEIIKGRCVVKEIYIGQDDQDFSEDDFQAQCLPG